MVINEVGLRVCCYGKFVGIGGLFDSVGGVNFGCAERLGAAVCCQLFTLQADYLIILPK